MPNKTGKDVFVAMAIVVGLAVTGIGAQKTDKNVPKQQKTLALGEDEVKQLIALMDADKNGKISKQEFMKFMEAEFERLDKDKNGELDQKELTQSMIRPAPIATGK